MKQADIAIILEYNYWANKRILTMASKVPEKQYRAPTAFPHGSLHGTLVHTLDAEYGWRTMLQEGAWASELTAAQFPSLASLETRWRDEEAALREYLAGLNDEKMLEIVRYKADEGNQRERVRWHCLYHVVNHGTQHRSEAAAMLTDYGQSPGEIDFTIFLNERK